jgi:hypothetical protein
MVPDARARLESAAVPPGEPESLAASRTATSMPALPRRPLVPAVDARARAANVPALHAASEADEVHQESGDEEVVAYGSEVGAARACDDARELVLVEQAEGAHDEGETSRKAAGEEDESVQLAKRRRPKGSGAQRRRDEKREREGIFTKTPARAAPHAAPLLVPPPRPPPGPPPSWPVPVFPPPVYPPPVFPPRPPWAQGQSRHLSWTNPDASPGPASRAAAHPRTAQHPIARAQQRARNAVAASARATSGAQAVALCAAQIAASAARVAARRRERAASAASLSQSALSASRAATSSSRADRFPLAVRFEGEVPQVSVGNFEELIMDLLCGQYVFIRTDDTCDDAPVYVLEEELSGDGDAEVVLYRVPSGMVLDGNVPGMFWVVRFGQVYLAYGVDRRSMEMRSDPCFPKLDGSSCGWYVGDYTLMSTTDVEAPGLRLVDALPESRVTRAALEAEHDEHDE